MGSRNACLKRTPNELVVMATEQDNSNLQVSFSPHEGAVKAKGEDVKEKREGLRTLLRSSMG